LLAKEKISAMRKTKWIIIGITCAFNIVLWSLFNRPENPEAGWFGKFNYVSFSPYRAGQDPIESKYPAPEEILDDLVFLKGKAKGIRSYSSLDGMEAIPGMAARLGFEVTAGAWLDVRYERNEDELYNLIQNANRYPATIKRVIVGNESIYRTDLSVEEVITYLDRVRAAVKVPVGTAEPWHVFINNPELVDHVDFIAIHVLPYWEKVPFNDSIGWVLERFKQVKEAFPNKPIFLAEVGWPSNGENFGKAKPSREAEAQFLRRFLNLADQRGLDYCIMEVFDQPWKKPHEGVVGAFWGIYDVFRKPKFSFQGPIRSDTLLYSGISAVLVGLLLVWFYLRGEPRQIFSGKLFFALLLQTTASVSIWVIASPFIGEFLFWETLIWALLLPMQAGLLMIILINGFEMSEMIWPEGLKRCFKPIVPNNDQAQPLVSIHVPICKEPPDMVIETLNSLAALEYPNYEVLVIDNNNPYPELWQPVQAHCETLGSRFRFFHLDRIEGYKAGALNFALQQSNPTSTIVAVVDSDYIVRPDWLRLMVPHFERSEVGVVQAPQDHRRWQESLFKEMINWEYHGFFEIGMVHRNERNAIIQHGTMTLIRKSILVNSGKWAEWCICEDAELGLRVQSLGYDTVYVKESFGKGLTPDSFAGYKRQRFRWVYGAVQIIKHHWSELSPFSRKSRLNMAQRYHFIAGWLPWFGDAISLIMNLLCILWAVGMALFPKYFGAPLYVLMLPPIGSFMFKLLHFVWLYTVRVPCNSRQRLGAALAGTALTHTIAVAILRGIFTKSMPFLRTPKCETKSAVVKGLTMARGETLMLVMMIFAAVVNYNFGNDQTEERLIRAALLSIQALPYAAALLLSILSVMPEGFRLPWASRKGVISDPAPASNRLPPGN
jgi:exo-beta-1,3-glucanase (GH17 family)/cellulose synthase/poly-beta-1,6-N-acetylglucosamine synthase-like glycosyltransferase